MNLGTISLRLAEAHAIALHAQSVLFLEQRAAPRDG